MLGKCLCENFGVVRSEKSPTPDLKVVRDDVGLRQRVTLDLFHTDEWPLTGLPGNRTHTLVTALL